MCSPKTPTPHHLQVSHPNQNPSTPALEKGFSGEKEKLSSPPRRGQREAVPPELGGGGFGVREGRLLPWLLCLVAR